MRFKLTVVNIRNLKLNEKLYQTCLDFKLIFYLKNLNVYELFYSYRN
jgi:hypothetical protein